MDEQTDKTNASDSNQDFSIVFGKKVPEKKAIIWGALCGIAFGLVIVAVLAVFILSI